jgi:hypothetical protein
MAEGRSIERRGKRAAKREKRVLWLADYAPTSMDTFLFDLAHEIAPAADLLEQAPEHVRLAREIVLLPEDADDTDLLSRFVGAVRRYERRYVPYP